MSQTEVLGPPEKLKNGFLNWLEEASLVFHDVLQTENVKRERKIKNLYLENIQRSRERGRWSLNAF